MARAIRLVFLIGAALVPQFATAAQPAEAAPRKSQAPATSSPLRFRRIYAPAERVQDWPRGTARYVPVEGEEFERLLKAALEQGSEGPAPASLSRAEYTAQFDGSENLQGSFAWEIERTGNASAALPLAPLSLALGKSRWSDSPRPVELGLDPDGAAVLIADRAGTVTGTWSLRSRRDNDGQLAFRFELPRAAGTTLLLTLPPGIVPTVTAGLASLVEEQADRHVYRILLGGASEMTLRIPSERAPTTDQTTVLLRESSVYNVSARGLELATVWKLDVHSNQVRKIVLSLDPGLQLVSARLGETELPFAPVADANPVGSQLSLDLPDALAGSDRPLRLSAIGPLPAGSKWTLPRIRASNFTWQEGTCTLLVHEPLAVRSLRTRDCRQTKYSVLPEPNRGESFEVQLFSDDSAVELDLERAQAVVQLSVGLNIELGTDAAQAELVAMPRVAHGRRSSFVADIDPDWSIDSVETAPRDALASWQVETAEAAPHLTVKLARPLSTESTVKLVIRGQRAATASAAGQWRATDLEPLRFRDVVDERFLTLRPAPALAIVMADAEGLVRIADEPAEAALTTLFLDPPRQPVYRLDPVASRFLATVHDEQSAFAAKVVGTATVDHTSIAESFSIRCQPDGEPVSRLVVQFSEPRPEPPRFSLVGAGEAALFSRRLSAAEQASAQLSAGAEAWQLVLATPQSAPFELRVDRVVSHQNETSLSLVSLPGAASQQAELVVEAAADIGISIRESGVNVVPSGDDPVTSITRTTFQYAPENAAARVIITRDGHALVPKSAAVVLHRRVASQYDVAGQSWHLATFQLRCAGEDAVALRVPEDCTITRLWLNGRTVPRPAEASPQIRLPADDSSVMLAVEYRSDGPALASGEDLWAPMADVDLPILSSEWLIKIPPGFELANVTGGLAAPAVRGFSWSERLFGPFGRGGSTSAIDPFSARGWSYLAERFSWGERTAALDFAARFSELSRGQDDAAKPADWGKLLVAADGMARDAGIKLDVDAVALADARIGPRTPIALQPAVAPERAQLGPLAQAGLALLYTPDAVLLTSRLSATIDRDQIRWIEPGYVGIPLPGPLRAALTPNSGDGMNFPSAVTWAEHGLDPAFASADVPPFDGDGGAALPYLIQIDGVAQPVVRLLHRSSWATWRAASCVLALAACACFVRRRKSLVVALLFALALALIVPQSLIPWATGALWGIALAIVWQWIAPRVRPVPRGVATPSTSSSVRRVVTATPVLLAILSATSIAQMASWAMAQQSAKPAARDETADRVHRVFIPVDEKEQPTKDKYQVPEQLYDELQRRVSEASGTTAGCLVRAARYQLSVSRDAMNDALVPNDVRAQFDVLVLRPDVVLRLPVIGVRSGPVAQRDGREIDLEWDTDEDGFSCRFAEPGLHQLDLSLRNQRIEATANSFEMAIPAVPQATATVQLPANAPAVEVPSAYGAATLAADGRTLSVQLGPTDRLSLRWARARQLRSPNVAGDADLWLWLQVQPASVVLHARLDIKSLKAPLSELWLSIDPRLRALPVVDRSGTVASVQPIVGDPQTVRIELARPVSDHVTIPVSFLLVGSSGIGEISLPRIEPPALRVSQRVLAISVEPALQFESPPVEPGAVMTVTDFLTHWGGAPAPPQAVLQLAADQPWTIATRPRASVTSARQRLGLSIGERRAMARFEATISPAEGQAQASGYVLQHQVRAPAELDIEKISLVQDGIDRVSRWTRDESGMISLFLAGPVTGRQQLSIDGWLPTPASGEWPLPRFDVESATRRETTITLARQSAVQITIADQHGLAEAERSRSADDAILPGRVAATLVATQSDYGATLRIAANAPHVRATIVATVQRDASGPVGQIDYRATVEDGLLDVITIELPASWIGPFEIAPPGPMEISASAGRARRLIVRPTAPVEGDFHFMLRGPIDFAAAEPIASPKPVLASNEQCATYFVLPTAWGNERLRWNTRGMQMDQLPEGVMSGTQASAVHVYRVNGADAAAWPTIVPVAAASLASTAEIHWLFNSVGANRGVAAFFLGNPERHAYHLLVPGSLQVLELRVGGRPRTPPRDEKGWKINVSPQDERQTIEVVFESRAPLEAAHGNVALAAPSLDGIEFDQTRWVVYAPAMTVPPQLAAVEDLPPLMVANRDEEPALSEVVHAAFGDLDGEQFAFAGTAPTIVLHAPALSPSSPVLRWLIAAVLAIGAVVFARRASTSFVAPPVWRWAILGVVVGVLALAWLRPAWPGVVIVLVGVGIVLWPRLRDSRLIASPDASGLPAAP